MAGDASASINHQGTSDTDTGGPVMGTIQGMDCALPAQIPQPREKNERQKYSSDSIFTSNALITTDLNWSSGF